MNFLDFWKGTQAYGLLLARKAKGEPIFTTQTEAERRAETCVSCPKHIDAEHAALQEKKWAEEWAKGKFRKQLQGRTTSQDAKLGKCAVCKCECRTLAHIHRDIISLTSEPEKHPAGCWKHNMR